MASIDIALGGQTFSARLLDTLAPKTCAALQQALPLSGGWIHTTWSGNLIQSYDPIELAVDELESQLGLEYPRMVMYSPALKQLAIAYGDARYCYSVSAEWVTTVAA